MFLGHGGESPLSFIRIEELHHTYHPRGHDPVDALNGVSLEIEAGDYVAVVGANGSGKTTLALHLNAILLPTKGTVEIDGRSTSDPAAVRDIRSRVGMVFQSPEDQMVATVVEEDVAFGPENLGVEQGLLEERVRQSLLRVGMWEERRRPPHQLSVGQKQRVAIAGALAMQPRCLVLDEATSMLDPRGVRDVLGIVEKLHGEGMTIVTVTHRMEEAARARRIVVLHEGSVAMEGSPRMVFADPRITEWRLNAPPLSRLVRRLKARFPRLREDLYEVEELAEELAEIAAS